MVGAILFAVLFILYTFVCAWNISFKKIPVESLGHDMHKNFLLNEWVAEKWLAKRPGEHSDELPLWSTF